MRFFFVIILFLVTLLWTYVGLSFIFPMLSGTGLDWLGWIFLAGTLGLQIWRWGFYARAEKSPRLLLAAYFSLGFISFLMVAALFKDILSLFFPLSSVMLFALFILSFLMNLQSLWIAKKGPQVKTTRIKTGFVGEPLRIVQLSDLHVGPIITQNYVENVVQMVSHLKPDLIVATGDMGDGDVALLSSALEPLRRLSQLAPCFHIPGNHEYYWNAQEWISKMESLGFEALINRGLPLTLPGKIPLWLGGVPDPQGARFIPSHQSDPSKAMDAKQARGRYKILLAHQPKSCYEAVKAGFDLMLCGHTHGGQFFPFTMLVGFFNPYTRGLNNHHGMKVYVNVGTGFWGPPLRLGARAEITCLELS